MTTVAQIGTGTAEPTNPAKVLRWSGLLLVAATWVSGAIFGAYILLFFGGLALAGTAARWNDSLPGLHDPQTLIANVAIGTHFVAGGALLLLGPIQLAGAVRRGSPRLHRWTGRIYVVCAGLAGLGGLSFILSKGTIGGPVMDTGFGLYGALLTTAAVLTFVRARQGRSEAHRAWAIRLFALVVGSWLYRMEYGFWFLAADGAGHARDFSGPFDQAMTFFFYLPNLAVAELFIRARAGRSGATFRIAAAGAMLAASVFVILATWTFTTDFWGPGMVTGLTGAPL